MSGVLRRWWPFAALIVLLLALQAKLWWGDGSWTQAKALQQKVSQQKAENARLQQRNDALSAEVEDLKSGESAIEDRARSELGMVKLGETFYRVVEPRDPNKPADAATAPDPPPSGAEPAQ